MVIVFAKLFQEITPFWNFDNLFFVCWIFALHLVLFINRSSGELVHCFRIWVPVYNEGVFFLIHHLRGIFSMDSTPMDCWFSGFSVQGLNSMLNFLFSYSTECWFVALEYGSCFSMKVFLW